jgi:type 1 fimbria pilin
MAPSLNASLVVNITGMVVEGGCKVNDSQYICVDFGRNLLASQIDGQHFMETLDYSLTCEDLTSNELELQFEGIAADFNDGYLATDKEGLGIKLHMNGEELPLNTWMPFSWPEVPVLQAVPVRNATTELDTGVFSASATIKIQYQ